jgi:hypothetical protein
MRSRLPALAVLAVGLLAGCGTDSGEVEPAAATPSTTVAWVGPSGAAVESEQAAGAALEAQRAEVERLAAEATAQAAAEATAQQAVGAAAARRAADEAAAAQADIEARSGDPSGDEDAGYMSSDLEVRCSDGTATVEECFGPGPDSNGNGIAERQRVTQPRMPSQQPGRHTGGKRHEQDSKPPIRVTVRHFAQHRESPTWKVVA